MNTKDKIHKTIEKYLVDREFYALESLLKNLKIGSLEELLPEELIQKAYNYYLVKLAPEEGIYAAGSLKKLTGIQPSEEIIQQGYRNIIRDIYGYIETRFELVEKLKNTFGVELSEDNRRMLVEMYLYEATTPRIKRFLKDMGLCLVSAFRDMGLCLVSAFRGLFKEVFARKL